MSLSAHRLPLAPVIGGLLLVVSGGPVGQESDVDLEATLARVGEQLERRYRRSQHIVSTETVWVRSFTQDMRPNGSPRRLVFERREERGGVGNGGAPTVVVFRELRSVNGREPTEHDVDACLSPRSESEDPLAVLLPMRQRELQFSLSGLEVVDGRRVARLDYVPMEEGRAQVTWDDDCVSISLRGRSSGAVWVDIESGEVVRFDERLPRRFEFREPEDRPQARSGSIVLERDDLSIRYERVTFEDPPETLMLPRSVEHSWVVQGSGFVPRYYRHQEFSNHRRFVTDSRVLEAPDATDEPGFR